MSGEYKRTPQREDSLLLYLETVCVDGDGVVDSRKVNAAEIEWMEEWDEKQFISFNSSTMDVWLSDDAWANAHHLRRAKALRRMQLKHGLYP